MWKSSKKNLKLLTLETNRLESVRAPSLNPESVVKLCVRGPGKSFDHHVYEDVAWAVMGGIFNFIELHSSYCLELLVK